MALWLRPDPGLPPYLLGNDGCLMLGVLQRIPPRPVIADDEVLMALGIRSAERMEQDGCAWCKRHGWSILIQQVTPIGAVQPKEWNIVQRPMWDDVHMAAALQPGLGR